MRMRGLILLALAARAHGCRFMIYVGSKDVDARALFLESENNLLTMATASPLVPAAKLSPRFNETQFKARNAELNLDGYGVSWYEGGDDPFPRRVRSKSAVVDPETGGAHGTLSALLRGDAVPTLFRASLDTCAEEVAAPPRKTLRSRALFGHVRAASTGEVSELNAHPFAFQTLTWLHNGAIYGVDAYAASILERLRPSVRALVGGGTDSELAGAVFANALAGFPERKRYDLLALRAAMLATVSVFREATRAVHEASPADAGGGGACGAAAPPSSLNFAVSDGYSLVATRYRSSPDEDPPTLYYKRNVEAGRLGGNGVLVSSEPTSRNPGSLREWILLGKNRMLSYSPDTGVVVECVDPTNPADCDDDVPAYTVFERLAALVPALPGILA